MSADIPPKIPNPFGDILNPIALMEELIYGSLAGVAICMGGHPFE